METNIRALMFENTSTLNEESDILQRLLKSEKLDILYAFLIFCFQSQKYQ